MLGDSFAGDLQTPKEKLGFGLVVLREGSRDTTLVKDSQLAVGSLGEVVRFLH